VDHLSGGILLYGGWDPCGPAGPDDFTDTWLWNGQAWSQVDTQGNPGPRRHTAMANDSSSGLTYLYGGAQVGVAALFRWDGQNWEAMPDHEEPGDLVDPRMATHPVSGMPVMMTASGLGWLWTPDGWMAMAPENSPPPRSGAAFAPDARRGEVVYLGGQDANGFTGDSWYWNTVSWTESNLGQGVGLRSGHAMAYDPGRGQLVLFGGQTERGVAAGTFVRF